MRGLPVALSLLPAIAAAQARVFPIEEPSGSVLGRVCEDLDGDGRCSERELGVPRARVLLDGGQVAQADEEGRFHFLAVPTRLVLPDRSAYGAHVVALESALGEPRVRRGFELAPGGAVQVDLAVPRVRAEPPPALVPVDRAGPAAPRGQGELAWRVGGRAPPGSRVEACGKPAAVDPDGTYAAEIPLAPGENRCGISVAEPSGRLSLHEQVVYLVERKAGGDLVVPGPVERLAWLELPPPGKSVGGPEISVRGAVSPGVELRVGEVTVQPAPSGEFQVRVPFEAGEAPLPLAARRGETRVTAAPLVRVDRAGGALAALADAEISFGSRVLVTGRAAAAGRGRWGEVEGELAVDLDDRDRSLDAVLHPRRPEVAEHWIAPERGFPTAGDGAAADDPNASRGRVHARLTAPGAALRAGNLRPGFTGREIGRYDRSLFGLKVEGRGEAGPLRLEGAAYGASQRADPGQAAPPRPAHDVLAATGGSLYYLRRGEVVAGSEALRVEWRDPLTGLVVDQRALEPGSDYEIDYPSGRVLLARPLSTVSGPPALLSGDPLVAAEATLHADYSFASAGGGDDDWGARGALETGPLRLEAAFSSEDRTGGGYRLGSAAVRLAPGPWLGVQAEGALSRGSAFGGEAPGFSRSLDGGLGFAAPRAPAPGEDHGAVHVEASGEAAGVRYAGWWRERPAGFSDSTWLEAVDARERGGSISYREGRLGLSGLVAERRGADPRDASAAARLDATEALARGSWRFEAVTLTGEARARRVDAQAGRGEQAGAGLRADWKALPWLAVDGSHHQTLWRDGAGPGAVEQTFTSAGATASWREASLSARGGWGPETGPRLLLGGERRAAGEATYGTFSVDPDAPAPSRQGAVAVGARRREGSAEVFAEEQLARDPFGLRVSRVAGLAFEPARWLRASLSAEAGRRLRLDGTEVGRGAAGATLAVRTGPLRTALRGEWRGEGADWQAVAGAAADLRLSARWTAVGRASWSSGFARGERVFFAAGSAGCAFRGEGVSLLARVAAVAEQRPGAAARRETGLASVAAAADLAGGLSAGLGLHLGLSRVEGARLDLLSGSARLAWRFWGPLDAAVEYARRQALRGDDPEHLSAGRLEAGVAVGEGRLAVGYNVFGFAGSGVDPGEEGRGRVYLRAGLVY